MPEPCSSGCDEALWQLSPPPPARPRSNTGRRPANHSTGSVQRQVRDAYGRAIASPYSARGPQKPPGVVAVDSAAPALPPVGSSPPPTPEDRDRLVPFISEPALPKVSRGELLEVQPVLGSDKHEGDLKPESAKSTKRQTVCASPVFEALRSQNGDLLDKLARKEDEMRCLQEVMKRGQKGGRHVPGFTGEDTGSDRLPLWCSAPCCQAITRLQRAGLNTEVTMELGAVWAGYVFSMLATQAKASGMSLAEVFKKYKNTSNKMDQNAFRGFVKRLLPDMLEDRITRLFFFADYDGSKCLNLLEFLRIFGADLNGKMGDEYFEYVMVRIYNTISKRGGLAAVLHIEDRHLQGTVRRTKLIEVLMGLKVELTRQECIEICQRFTAPRSSDVVLSALNDTMQMCASAAFVTDEWAHRVFHQLVHAVHHEAQSLAEALGPCAQKGTISRDDLQTLLVKFDSSLRESQIDRIFAFLCQGTTSHGNRPSIDVSHFLHMVCKATLGNSVQVTKGGGVKKLLPSETLERLSLQLRKFAGNLDKAFHLLNPSLQFEEFRSSLLNLGFSPDVDFHEMFRLLDVHRTGKVFKSTFLQALDLTAHDMADGGPTDKMPTAEEEQAAAKIQSAFRVKKLFVDERGQLCTGGVADDLQYRQHKFAEQSKLWLEKSGKTGVPAAAFDDLVRDHQRAINRVLALEMELAYLQRSGASANGWPQPGRSPIMDRVARLQTANRILHGVIKDLEAAHAGDLEHFRSEEDDDLGSADAGLSAQLPSFDVKSAPPRRDLTSMRSACFLSDDGVGGSDEEGSPMRLASSRPVPSASDKEVPSFEPEDAVKVAMDCKRVVRLARLNSQASMRSEASAKLFAEMTLQQSVPSGRRRSAADSTAESTGTKPQRRSSTRRWSASFAALEDTPAKASAGADEEVLRSRLDITLEELALLHKEKKHKEADMMIKLVELERQRDAALVQAQRALIMLKGQQDPPGASQECSLGELCSSPPRCARSSSTSDMKVDGRPTLEAVAAASSDLRQEVHGSSNAPMVVARDPIESVIAEATTEPAANSSLTSEEKLLDALHIFARNRDSGKFLELVQGISVAHRFVIKSLVTVESDSVVLRGSDAFMNRDVAVKLPLDMSQQPRRAFLRECCIYAFLNQVLEVQDVVHFPGQNEQLTFCITELLSGRLLAERLEEARQGNVEALPQHDAAEICDALLHGLQECHRHGVIHLDIKPSVVWEVMQPAGVIVKILDFGMARATDLGMMAPDARFFFEGTHNGAMAPSSQDELPDFEIDSGEAPNGDVKVPDATCNLQEWSKLAVYAQLPNVGNPWYMSPARLSNFAMRYQRGSSPQPELRWCDPLGNQIRSIGMSRETGLYVVHAAGDDMDTVGVKTIPEVGLFLPAQHPAPHFETGSYFEVEIKKIWPRALLFGAVHQSNGHVGLGLGFSCVRPDENLAMTRGCRSARELKKSWVFGYDGRVYANAEEIEAPEVTHIHLHDMRKRDEREDWPTGPLGWSFAVLRQGDRLGLFVDEYGFVTIIVNARPISRVKLEGINGLEPLYPIIELCGIHREVALEPHPHAPSAQDVTDRGEQYDTVQSLSARAFHAYADTYATAILVQECFCASLEQKKGVVPTIFARLLLTIRMWLGNVCPPIEHHGDMLLVLSQWAAHSRVRDDLEPQIARVLRRVLDVRSGQPGRIRNIAEFRQALNEVTSCCHITPDFLMSHTKTTKAAVEFVRPASPKRWNILDKFSDKASAEVTKRDQHWDLSWWILSSSHVRRVSLVLGSEEGAHIDSVAISRLEPHVPSELKVRLVSWFCQTLEMENDSKPALVFDRVHLPVHRCPFPFMKLWKANVVSIILRFVRSVDVQEGVDAKDPPIGLPGADELAEALKYNGMLFELKARGQAFGDEGAERLAAALVRGSGLGHLDLASNGIREKGVQAIATAMVHPEVKLQHLDLSSNLFGDAGCKCIGEVLGKTACLKALIVQRCGIDASGATSLASALLLNSSLTSLDLGRNIVGAEGAAALISVTRSNVSLQDLNLQDNKLDTIAAVQMAEALGGMMMLFPMTRETNKWSSVRRPSTTDAMRSSVQRTSVTNIGGQGGGRRGSTTGADAFDVNRQRRRSHMLGENDCSVSNLKSLNLRHNNLGSSGAATMLEAVAASGSNLRRLSLAWNDMGLSAAVAIANLFGPSAKCCLEELDVRDNPLAENGALGIAFGRIAALMAGTKQTDRRLSTDRTNTAESQSEVPSSLAAAQHLKQLNLGNCRIDPDSLAQLVAAAPVWSKLEALFLYNNPGIGDCKQLVGRGIGEAIRLEVVPQTGLLRSLSTLAARLSQTLQHLSLGSCLLGNEAAMILLRRLSGRHALKHLDLSDNLLGELDNVCKDTRLEQMAMSLSEAVHTFLEQTQGLRNLNLALNSFRCRDALQIMQRLCKDAPHVTVDLTANPISHQVWNCIKSLDETNWDDLGQPIVENAVVASDDNELLVGEQTSLTRLSDRRRAVGRRANVDLLTHVEGVDHTTASDLFSSPRLYRLGDRLVGGSVEAGCI